MTIKIARVIQTGWACPSQWDAWDTRDKDHDYYYLRFRHGCGSVTRYPADDVSTGRETLVAEFFTDDPLDGVISLKEFAERAGIELAPEIY